jgi:hypothetical protein
MQIDLVEIKGVSIAEIISDEIVIRNTQDALDLMADCGYQGARNIIIEERHVVADFFNLRTGIAGEILQKFSNYKVKLAIIGDYSKYDSKSLRDFIYESNKGGRINFVSNRIEAREKLVRE